MNILSKTILGTSLVAALLIASSAHAGKVGNLKDYAPDPQTGVVKIVDIRKMSR